MKKLLLMAAASMALSAVASTSANATSLADWTFDKVKLTHIDNFTLVDKDVLILVTDRQPLNSAAQSLAVVNSDIIDDEVTYATVDVPDGVFPSDTGQFDDNGNPFGYDLHRHAVITGSIIGNVGVGQVNQDAGNNSNQGNVVSAALVFGGDDLAQAEAYEQDINVLNTSYHVEAEPNTTAPNITALITTSVNGNTGVFMVNQNAGNMNSQHNVLSAAVGDAAFTALADAGLSQVNGGNTVYEANSVKAEDITGSVNSNHGIVTVNQSVGNMNNQATVINLAVLSSSVGL